jgi:hypothetical protein
MQAPMNQLMFVIDRVTFEINMQGLGKLLPFDVVKKVFWVHGM